MDNRHLFEAVEIQNPLAHLVDDSNEHQLASYFAGRGFVLFSLEHDAVILYSSECEFKLVAGEARFVKAYIDGAEVDPVAELEEWFGADITMWQERGDPRQAKAINDAFEKALSQVKLPHASLQPSPDLDLDRVPVATLDNRLFFEGVTSK